MENSLPSRVRPRLKEIYIMQEPIDLLPNETFTVNLTFPTSIENRLSNFQIFKYKISWPCYFSDAYLDGILIRAHKCQCPIKTLMEAGCQCGGI